MKNVLKISVLCFGILLLVCAAGFASMDEDSPSEDVVTITGVVNENFQIVTAANKVVEIGDTAEGDDVVRLIGQKVSVTGVLKTYDDAKFILVETYEILE